MSSLFSLGLSAVLATAVPTGAEAEVREAVERYFQADARGSAEDLRSAFAPGATVLEKRGGRWAPLTPEALAGRSTGVAADEARRVRRVDSLRAASEEASVVVTLDTPTERRRELLTLRRVDGAWRIVRDRRETTPKPSPVAQMQQLRSEWMKPVPPFRLLGNLHYVGASDISAFLLTTPAGHVLLDGGPVEMLPRLERNLEALGFRLADVKVILNSQAHFDHCGGFAELRRRTGAVILASEADATLMEQGGKGDFAYGDDYPYEAFTPDRRIRDGEQVQLGDVTLTATLTPGHTRGCTTWSTRIEEGGRTYGALFVCGLTVSPFKLTNNPVYPAVADDARRSIARLRSLRADVMLAAHGFWFDLTGKAARLARARRRHAPNPFVDPAELGRHLDEMTRDLDQALSAQERPRAP
ncbi:MAG TPA: subclass B3 metallo-beta-lactamase [Myxococcaceae bacterium]|nr:subclass B3 metallo-beta-lactamase [Myxococcaceae bacterium]